MLCRRPRRAPKQTGMLLVDSVRQRAFECRLSMRDLDAFVGKKHYFAGPRYIDWRALQRAIRILGGRPVVCWRNGCTSSGHDRGYAFAGLRWKMTCRIPSIR